MKSVNKEQRRYITQRIWNIQRQKVHDLEKAMGVITDQMRKQQKKERIKQIRNGKAKIKKTISLFPLFHALYIHEVFNFEATVKPSDADIHKVVEKYNNKIDAVKKEAVKIEDEVMLGDQTQALKLIIAFATS